MALRSFNPRPREGATRQRTVLSASPSVSIHAPVKGRLVDFGLVHFDIDVSIHAPVKGRPAG